ncbi:hypothetical protein ROZALSC1DRAFT_26004, partial [Rozella allomycis CSF55]
MITADTIKVWTSPESEKLNDVGEWLPFDEVNGIDASDYSLTDWSNASDDEENDRVKALNIPLIDDHSINKKVTVQRHKRSYSDPIKSETTNNVDSEKGLTGAYIEMMKNRDYHVLSYTFLHHLNDNQNYTNSLFQFLTSLSAATFYSDIKFVIETAVTGLTTKLNKQNVQFVFNQVFPELIKIEHPHCIEIDCIALAFNNIKAIVFLNDFGIQPRIIINSAVDNLFNSLDSELRDDLLFEIMSRYNTYLRPENT